MIYLDNAATTPVLPEVVDTMTAVLRETYGNPSSVHSAGRKASQILRAARKTVATSLDVPAASVSFTSGGSESNNTAIIGYALAHRDRGNHILTTAIEHPSVLEAVKYLQVRHGFEATFVKPLADGSFPASLIEDQLRPDTLLVSMMMANNETGQLLPVQEVGALLQDHPAAFHVDAVQTVGKLPIRPVELGADFLSASAHKFHGPKGVGFLYQSQAVSGKLDSLIHGGEQETKRRAGTENLAGIAGLAKALEIASAHSEKNLAKVTALHERLLAGLAGIDYYQNSFGDSLPHVLNLGFPGQNHDILLTQLDLAGVAISTGSACTAGTIEPSHVLAAIYGEDSPKLKENIRISLSELTTEAEIDTFTSTLKGLL